MRRIAPGLLLLALAMPAAAQTAAPASSPPSPPAATAPAETEGGRIVNGEPAKLTTAPWQLLLYWQHPQGLLPNGEGKSGSTSFCGAVLIDRQWALTARHCIAPNDGPIMPDVVKAAVTIGAGHLQAAVLTTREATAQRRRIDRIEEPGDFRPVGGGYNAGDIVLLHLDKPLLSARIPGGATPMPVALAPPDLVLPDTPGVKARISGWGATTAVERGRGSGFSDVLRYADVDVLGQQACLAAGTFDDPASLRPNMICAWTKRSENFSQNVITCSGDSGGPLVWLDGQRRVLIGLVSGAVGCGPRPAVFTRISSYTQWIRERMAEK